MTGAIWPLILAGLFAAAQAFLFSRLNLKALTYSRRFSRARASEGERVQMIEVLLNRKPLPVPWLRVESRISPNLRFGETARGEREITENRYHRSVFFLPPMAKITRTHTLTCLKRGAYDAGSVALTAGDLFAMSASGRQLKLDCKLLVWPRILGPNEIDPPSSRWQGDVTVKRWIQPDPFLVSGIRDMRPGDPMRDVHWGATARLGQMQVKTRDYTADPRLLVVLNVQMSENQWADLMEYETEMVEQGIRIAATLCLRALRTGVEAGFAANADSESDPDALFLPPCRSFDQGERLLDAMARMRIRRALSFPTLLDRLTALRDTDILILTAYRSETLEQKAASLRRAGNSVTFGLLEGGIGHA